MDEYTVIVILPYEYYVYGVYYDYNAAIEEFNKCVSNYANRTVKLVQTLKKEN